MGRSLLAMSERVVFEAAIEITDPEARRSFVEKACAGNPGLAVGVFALLDSHDKIGAFLEDSPVGAGGPRSVASSDPLINPAESATNGGETDSYGVLRFLTPSTRADSLGRLGHYEVLRLLGEGGFGTVLKAFDEKLHRLVAIKVLIPALAATSPPRKRFLREARSGAAIKHENVVRVYSVEDQPSPYFVMELVDGSTLQDRMNQQGPLEVSEIFNIGRQIASGLAAAHAMGFIHRDIKPGNILLEPGIEWKVKITDFGLARVVNEASLTQSGMVIGTPMYMAPEQATGGKLDHRADLFSLGSVLYAMASGHPPFRAPDRMAVLRRVAEDSPRPLHEMVPDLPDRLVTIIDKLLAKNPDDRFQTAREVADLLGPLQGNRPSSEAVKTVADMGAPPSKSEPVITIRDDLAISESTSATAAKMRRRWLMYGLSAMPILLLAGVLYMVKDEIGASSRTDPPKNVTEAESPSSRRVATSPVPETADSERALSKWVLAQPGMEELLVTRQGEIKTEKIKHVGELPSGKFVVSNIILKNVGEITDDDLARIGKAEALRRLVLLSDDFHMPRVTDKGLESLFREAGGRDLWYLEIWSDLPNVTEKGYLAFNNGQALRTLYLQLPPEKGAFLSRLAILTLDHLGIVGERIPDGSFEGLPSRMPSLRILQLQGARVTAPELQVLSRLKLLKIVRLVGCGLDDTCLAVLGKLDKLTELKLDVNPGITDRGVAHLAKLAGLELVNLNETAVGDEACKILAALPALADLSMSQTQVGDGGLETLATLKTLKRLDLQHCVRITDKALESLAKLESLKDLNIKDNSEISESAVRKLQSALPNCEITSDFPAK
jgi:serine/threonine protein kinase